MESSYQRGPQLGDVVGGRYVVGERIGQGGMGCVFLADQPSLERRVAIKFLHPELIDNPDLVRRIHQEAVLACRVRDPHCVAVLDWGTLPDRTPYLVMEHIPGRPLGRVLIDEPVPLARAIDLFGQVLAAIAAAHRSGILHGDVKSDNFLVEAIDGTDHVTLIDFGLAQVIGAPPRTDLEHGEIMISGTPDYMAPEVIGGDPPSRASDLYGAGVILYELLTGTTPFGGGTAMEIMLRHARDKVTPPSQRRPDRGIPPMLDGVVLKALEKRPDARFCDAPAFARELDAAAQAAARWIRSVALGQLSLPTPAAVSAVVPPRRRLARGSDCSGARHTTKLPQQAIADALRRGDVAAIADGYLQLARALADRQQFAGAVSELQEALDVVTAGGATVGGDAARAVDRLVVALAALYEETGDCRLARWVATSTDDSPTWTFEIDPRSDSPRHA